MKKYLALIILSSIVVSCDSQIGTAIGTALKNVATGKVLGSVFSDSAYEEYRKKTLEPKKVDVESPESCKPGMQEASLLSSSSNENLSNIRDVLCTCKTWGTCDANSCSCGILCPDSFEILNRTGLALDDSHENSLSFTNNDSAFFEKDSNYAGYCWGHATITQKFNRLAKFDGTLERLYPGIENEKERIAYFKEIVEKLNNNEAVDIPGYRNLNEFSRNPEVKAILQDAVKDEWATNAMTVQGMAIIASSEPQGVEHYNKLFDDIEFRLKNHQSPTILFNQRGNALMAHSVLVSGAGISRNGERYLCLRDNNYHAQTTQNCGSKLRLTRYGTCYYDSWAEGIGKVELSHTENANTLEQMKNLRSRCQTDKKCSSN